MHEIRVTSLTIFSLSLIRNQAVIQSNVLRVTVRDHISHVIHKYVHALWHFGSERGDLIS
jgi:hypothetical protein